MRRRKRFKIYIRSKLTTSECLGNGVFVLIWLTQVNSAAARYGASKE